MGGGELNTGHFCLEVDAMAGEEVGGHCGGTAVPLESGAAG